MARKGFRRRGFALPLALALALAGCGGDDGGGADGGAAAANGDESAPKAVLVSIQPVNDQGVMQDFVKGFEAAAEEYGYASADVVELEDPSTYTSTLQAVSQENDLVITTFPPMIQAVETVAPKFPDVNYVLLDGQTEQEFPNLQTLFFYENQSSYLAGIVAGMMTETDKVGFLGGIKQDVINRYLVGFHEGVKAVNPDAQVCWSYVGDLANPSLGKQFALQLYGRGIDILHAATAGTQVGVYQAAEEAEKYLISADVDVRPLAPNYGLTAAGPDFASAAKIVMEQHANGNFQAGRQQYGLESESVRLLPFNDDLVPQKVQDRVAEAEEKIISGEIEVAGDEKLPQLKNCG